MANRKAIAWQHKAHRRLSVSAWNWHAKHDHRGFLPRVSDKDETNRLKSKACELQKKIAIARRKGKDTAVLERLLDRYALRFAELGAIFYDKPAVDGHEPMYTLAEPHQLKFARIVPFAPRENSCLMFKYLNKPIVAHKVPLGHQVQTLDGYLAQSADRNDVRTTRKRDIEQVSAIEQEYEGE